MGEKRGTKALETWCRRVTDGYRDVRVDNMTTSWRDGMAFCALIHHFRPDLIDFDSLSKENIYENNNLAFIVAEQHLGIPALLEPEDMVKYAIPDRLSILTYVSQYFAALDGPGKKMSPTKRPLVETTSPTTETPTDKVASKVMARVTASPGTGPGIGRGSPGPETQVPIRHDVCQACHNRVYILERLIVDSKLYHRICFKCSKCQTVLSPGSYVESESRYECASCPAVEKEAHRGRLARTRFPTSPKEPELEVNPVQPCRPPVTHSYTSTKPFSDFISKLTNEESVDATPPVTDTGQEHKDEVVEDNSGDLDSVPKVTPTVTVHGSSSSEEELEVKVDASENDKEVAAVNVPEEEEDGHGRGDSSLIADGKKLEKPPPKPSRSPVPAAVSASLQEPWYPDHLNPFGDDDEDEGEGEDNSVGGGNDDEEENRKVPAPEMPEKRIGDWILRPRAPQPEHYTSQRRNPFGSYSDEDLQSDVTLRSEKPVPSPRRSVDSSKISAPPVKILRKKKPAPSPPRPVTVLVVPSHKDQMPLPKPRPRSVGLVNTLMNTVDKSQKELDNHNLRTPSDNLSQSSNSPTSPRNRNTFGYWKKKKPAPPVPLPPKRQIRKIPLKEIFTELEEIEERQLELERKGVEIEKSIRERFSTSDPSTEEEDLILHLFELVNKKNGLFRRQAELIYMKRQQRLEEEHADLEFQIRCLMEKSAHKKTDAERIFEEQLIERLVEVVKQRNEIVESMEMDRLREREEDESIQEKMALHQTLGARRSSGGSGSSVASSSQSPASSEKSSKKDKKVKQGKGGNKKSSTHIDADKDIDESESLPQVKSKKDKKKKWF